MDAEFISGKDVVITRENVLPYLIHDIKMGAIFGSSVVLNVSYSCLRWR